MAAITNPYNQYIDNKVNNTNKSNLVIMLYDSAIRNIKEAQKYIEEKNFFKKAEAIDMSYVAVSELLKSLDFKIGGEIAQNLSKIYNYILREITSANVANDASKLDMPLKILKDFRVTWKEVIQKESRKAI